MRPAAWSYSRLTSFEQCPRRFYKVQLRKELKEKPNEKTDYGSAVHLAFAAYLTKGQMLPLAMRHHQKTLDMFKAQPGEHIVEQKVAINAQYGATGWFDDDVWCRVISDLTIVNGNRALSVDWKTGKMSDDFTQLKLVGAVLFQLAPELEKVSLAYVWLQNKKITQASLTPVEALKVWNELLPRVKRYQEAHDAQDFPARQNAFCRNCPDVSCPFNEAKR